MKAHEKLVQTAKDAIDKVFGDTSVPQSTTLESLREIKEEVEYKISAVEADNRESE